MKMAKLLGILALTGAVVKNAYAAGEEGPYAYIEGGSALLEKWKNEVERADKRKAGGVLRAALGYKFNDFFKTEIEASYFRIKTSEERGIIDADDGSLISLAGTWKAKVPGGFFNLYLDVPIADSPVYPYIGAGVGLLHISSKSQIDSASVNGVAVSPGLITAVYDMTEELKGKTETKAAFQGIVGVNCNLTDDLSARINYRYLTSSKLKSIDEKIQTHSFNVGLLFQF